MGSKPLSFQRAFRTPSALSYLLKRMPEIDINDLGLGDEENIRHGREASFSSSPATSGPYDKPLHSFPCAHVFRKLKSPSKQVSQIPEAREDQKVRVKITRSVSFHRFPRHVSVVADVKHTGTDSKMTSRRIFLDSEPVTKQQKHSSCQGTGTGKNGRQRQYLCETAFRDEDRPDVQEKWIKKRKKLVRFIEEPEIIPRSSVALDYGWSEEPIHGHFQASISFFQMLKR